MTRKDTDFESTNGRFVGQQAFVRREYNVFDTPIRKNTWLTFVSFVGFMKN